MCLLDVLAAAQSVSVEFTPRIDGQHNHRVRSRWLRRRTPRRRPPPSHGSRTGAHGRRRRHHFLDYGRRRSSRNQRNLVVDVIRRVMLRAARAKPSVFHRMVFPWRASGLRFRPSEAEERAFAEASETFLALGVRASWEHKSLPDESHCIGQLRDYRHLSNRSNSLFLSASSAFLLVLILFAQRHRTFVRLSSTHHT